MKKILIMCAVLMLLLPLTACGGQRDTGEVQNDEALPFRMGGEGGDLDIPPISSLLVGTLLLEDTDLAVSYDMASELLPLWQAARTIFTSDTSASEERDAILDQIGETMTAEQLAAIQAMELTTEDMRGMLRELLGDVQTGSLPGDGDPASPRGGRGQGQGLPGFVPGEGLGGPGLGQAMDPEAQATAQAARSSRGEMLANPMLFEIIIELLQSRADEG